jgi:uncharacterized membrane protein
MEAFLVLLGLAVVFGPAILAVVALVKAAGGREALKRTEATLAHLRRRIEALEQSRAPQGSETSAPAPAEILAEPAAGSPAPSAPPAAPPVPSEAPAAEDDTAAAAAMAADSSAGGIEKAIASKWLVWLGAATVALGGTFLVKHSIESGWLGPAVRELLGIALGAALIAGAEWLRRRPRQRALVALQPDYVPQALAAAGIFSIFACVYTAYGLYGLIGPLAAFFALALTAFVAVGLSLLQGPLVAVVGIAGGYVTPMLVASGQPSPWTLFVYLLALGAAALAVLRFRRWWWLGYVTLAGAAFWPLFWLAAVWTPGDVLPLGLYLLALAAAFFYFVRDFPFAGRPWGSAGPALFLNKPDAVTWAAAAVILLLFFCYVRTAEYAPTALVFLGLLSLLHLFVGRREAALDWLAPAAAGLVAALVLTWHLPSVLAQFEAPYAGPLLPIELVPFATATAILAALFAGAGFAALWGARRPGVWAGVSAGTPTLLFTIAYWRFVDFGLDLHWAFAALALAALAFAVASQVARYRHEPALQLPLALYAAAVTAFIALGAAMTLSQAWLTVAYAAQLLALALIYERVTVVPLRWVALAAAVLVLIRLVLNWNVLAYDDGQPPVFGWVLYGYGLPALMFFEAARRFRRDRDDLLVAVLEAGWIAFAVLLVSFEIRIWATGALDALDYDLTEQSLQTAAWLAIAYALMQGHARAPRPILLWASRLLLCLAALQVTLLQVLMFNPVAAHVAVGGYPVINLLLLAYGVPAIFAFLAAPLLRQQGARAAALVAGGFGFALGFLYLTLEVRRALQGPFLDGAPPSGAELYAYSAAWLAYALVLLGLAIWMKRASLRYASLIALSLTVVKVFLIDAADLSGLYRVASVLGLGLCLIAIGYVYQRYVFPTARRGAAPQEQA